MGFPLCQFRLEDTMKSARTAVLEKLPENARDRLDALLKSDSMTISELEETSRLLGTMLAACRLETRQMVMTKSRHVHRNISYVAHVERFA